MPEVTEEQLKAIEERAEKASPAPWFWNSYNGIFSKPLVSHEAKKCPDCNDDMDAPVAWVPPIAGDTALGRHANDAEFIGSARQDVPLLTAEVRRLRAKAREEHHCSEEVIAIKGDEIDALRAENEKLRLQFDRLGRGMAEQNDVAVKEIERLKAEGLNRLFEVQEAFRKGEKAILPLLAEIDRLRKALKKMLCLYDKADWYNDEVADAARKALEGKK